MEMVELETFKKTVKLTLPQAFPEKIQLLKMEECCG